LLKPHDDCHLVEHNENQGKGAAILSGAEYARELKFTHIIQIDADGQHDVNDIEHFTNYSEKHPGHIISGAPSFDESAPKARVYGRKVTDFWVALETLSLGVKDCLCGFRIYPLDRLAQLVQQYRLGQRMDFDTEILVKAVWSGIPLHFIKTKVIYPANSVSHFHYLRDNLGLIWLHVRLMFGMLLRLPKLLCWRLTGRKASA
jgi:glycosyltransferase involved in cell wall biosynthesis